jgi:hypothetical protein
MQIGHENLFTKFLWTTYSIQIIRCHMATRKAAGWKRTSSNSLKKVLKGNISSAEARSGWKTT